MNIGTSIVIRICLVLAGVLLSSAAWSADPKFNAMYVFGDSLSDTGNDRLLTRSLGISPAIPPSTTPNATYFQGRFSNGPVAVEYLWQSLTNKSGAGMTPSLGAKTSVREKAGISFAFGGSGSGQSNATPGGFLVPGLLGQVDSFRQGLQEKAANSKALYLLWTGSNDYILGLSSNPGDVVGNIVAAIQALYAVGARDFLVPNLPDIGLSPLSQASGSGALLTQLTQIHNAVLEQALVAVEASLPAARIVRMDVYGITQTLIGDGTLAPSPPALDYLAPSSGASSCLFVNPANCIDIDMNAQLPWPFLFWDVLHPTTQWHVAIGNAMYGALLAAYR